MKVDRDLYRINLSRYTILAFQLLPAMKKPRILDIGCGTGVPTIKLAELCDGEIIGIDSDKRSLAKLNHKIAESNLSGRVRTIYCHIDNLPFDNERFDILWAEGSISFVGFERGITEWRRLLRREGYLVIHDELSNYQAKIRSVEENDYTLEAFFKLTESVWWNEYYRHLDQLLDGIRSSECSGEVDRIRKELEIFKTKPESVQSAFFVLKKI